MGDNYTKGKQAHFRSRGRCFFTTGKKLVIIYLNLLTFSCRSLSEISWKSIEERKTVKNV